MSAKSKIYWECKYNWWSGCTLNKKGQLIVK